MPLLVLVARFARQGDDERSFFAAIGAALALSPIVWLHYLVLLAVPLAIARPRFSPLWLLPIVLWVCPRSGNGDGVETFLPVAVTAIVLGLLLVRPRREPRGRGGDVIGGSQAALATQPPLLERVKWYASIVFCGALPAVALIVFYESMTADGTLAFDFRPFYRAAGAILDGETPYPAADDPLTAWTGPYVYPPLGALVSIPFRAVSFDVAGVRGHGCSSPPLPSRFPTCSVYATGAASASSSSGRPSGTPSRPGT